MFRGRRAWFSQSVSPGPRALWAAGGGALAHRRDAEFLFSSDAAHPDTRRIHESLDYVEGRATIFHSRCLSVWASGGTGVTPSVALGHFVLPPACLQEEIRRKIGCFIWEQVDDPTVEQGPQGTTAPQLRCSQPDGNLLEEPEVVNEGCKEGVEEDAPGLDESSEEEPGSRAPAQGGSPYRALQEYPMSNMVTGYASARHMKKYTGELRDFTPGTSGYAVYWVRNRINICSDARARARRNL
ncbi:telomere repeats-binding bouquet formation protein 2 [Aegotheles albertisi]